MGWWSSPWSAAVFLGWAVLSVVVAVGSSEHRGLSNTVAGLHPVITPWGGRDGDVTAVDG